MVLTAAATAPALITGVAINDIAIFITVIILIFSCVDAVTSTVSIGR
jgi:type IV secretory pathway VirB3-like protein